MKPPNGLAGNALPAPKADEPNDAFCPNADVVPNPDVAPNAGADPKAEAEPKVAVLPNADVPKAFVFAAGSVVPGRVLRPPNIDFGGSF